MLNRNNMQAKMKEGEPKQTCRTCYLLELMHQGLGGTDSYLEVDDVFAQHVLLVSTQTVWNLDICVCPYTGSTTTAFKAFNL